MTVDEDNQVILLVRIVNIVRSNFIHRKMEYNNVEVGKIIVKH